MSYADKVFIDNVTDIMQNGVWDTDLDVRPRWEDGTPAHTVKKFCIVNRYDLSKEFPILTIRRTFIKSAAQELLWIWQKKSNKISELESKIAELEAKLKTALSVGSISIKKACSTRWTACCTTSNTTGRAEGS